MHSHIYIVSPVLIMTYTPVYHLFTTPRLVLKHFLPWLHLCMLYTKRLMHRVMSDLAPATAVDHCLAATTLLELHLSLRLVESIVLAGRVGASDELFRKLHVHPLVHCQRRLGHPSPLVEAGLDEEVHEQALAGRPRPPQLEEG